MDNCWHLVVMVTKFEVSIFLNIPADGGIAIWQRSSLPQATIMADEEVMLEKWVRRQMLRSVGIFDHVSLIDSAQWTPAGRH